MKTKDMVYLVLAVAILLGAGFLAYTQVIAPKSAKSKVVTAEVVGAISPDFDAAAITMLNNPDKVRDYNVDIDIHSGVNNASIFGK